MKLLIFSPYYPPHIGGLESHADEFNKYLSERNVDITVFTPRLPREALDFEILHNNVKVFRFPAFEIISSYPLPKFWKMEFWKIFSSLFDEDFDIIISRTRFFFTSLLALFYAKTKGIKWIHIEHGSDFVRLSSKFKTFIAKVYDYSFGLIVFKFSDLNVSISNAVQKFVSGFDKRNSPVIYRGLNFDKIDAVLSDLELRNKYKEKIIITFAGRLYKWKGVEKSIQAIKSLPQKTKNEVVFLILGDGEDFNSLAALVDESIVLLGSLPREKVISIQKISDIYIHSAYAGGGLSTSLLEAMYCECAVISTPNEGADEIIENDINGLLIDNPDSQEIAQKIILLSENPELRKKLSQQAKKDVFKNFSWEKTIEKYIKILKK